MPDGATASSAVPDWYAALPSPVAPAAAPIAQTAKPANANSANLPDWYNALPDVAPTATSAAQPGQAGQASDNMSLADRVAKQGPDDVSKQAAIGLGEGIVGFSPPGLVLNASSLADRGLNYLASKTVDPAADYVATHVFGETPEHLAAANAWRDAHEMHIPSTNDLINKGLNLVGSEIPQPQTTAGAYANTIGQFAAGPGAILPKLGAAVTSETAGQLTKGTDLETPARILGAMGGGMGVSAAGEGINAAKDAAQGAGYFGGKAEPVPNVMQPNEPLAANPAQMKSATQNVMAQATDKDATLAALKQPIQTPLGAQPTLAEVVPDQGIAQGQNAIRQIKPEPFQANDAARNTAIAGTLDKMSNAGNPDSIGAYIQKIVADDGAKADAQEGALGKTAAAKLSPLGQYGTELPEGVNPTGNVITDARAVRKNQSQQEYGLLDSVNGAPSDMVTLRNAAQDVQNYGKQYGNTPIGSTVQRLTDTILKPPEGAQDTVATLRNFRSQISAAQRALPQDQSYDSVHLQTLKQAANKGLQNTVQGLALQNEDFYNDLVARRDAATQAAAQQPGAGSNTQVSGGGNAARSGALFSGKAGAAGEAGEQPPAGAGSESVPGAPSAFGKQQLDQYNQANTNYARRMTMGELENSGVVDSTGQLDSGKFSRWIAKPRTVERLNADPQFRDQLKDAATAQSTLDTFRAQRVEAQEAFQKSRLGKFIEPGTDPVSMIGKIFRDGAKNPEREFEQLTQRIRQDPEALKGWQAATSQYINDRIAKASLEEHPQTNAPMGRVGRPDALRQFIQQNKGALREIYQNGQGLNNLEQVAALIRRKQDMEGRANIPGQSNTAKNAAQMAKRAGTVYDWLTKVMRGAGAGAGAHIAGAPGAMAGEVLGDTLGSALKSARFNTIEKVELAMYANPEFAKQMAQRFGASNPPIALKSRIAAQVRKLVPGTLTSSSPQNTVKREQQPSSISAQ